MKKIIIILVIIGAGIIVTVFLNNIDSEANPKILPLFFDDAEYDEIKGTYHFGSILSQVEESGDITLCENELTKQKEKK